MTFFKVCVFILLLFFHQISSKKEYDGLVFRSHGKTFIGLDKCISNPYAHYESGYFSFDEKKNILTYNQCEKEHCEGDCSKTIEVEYLLEEFIPFPYYNLYNNDGNARILSKGKAMDIEEEGFALVSFATVDACLNKDFSEATSLIYINDDSHLGCLKYSEKGGIIDSSKSCVCNHNTHELECLKFENSTTCEGIGVVDVEDDLCDKSFFRHRICGKPDLSSLNNGLLVDMSVDVFIKKGEMILPPPFEMCLIIVILDDHFTMKICNYDCSVCPEEKQFSQEYSMKKNVYMKGSLLNVDSPYNTELYAYGHEQLKIEKGKKNDQGYIDIQTDLTMFTGTDYFFSYRKFEYCQDGEKYLCGDKKEGIITKLEFSNSDCSGDPTTTEDLKEFKCGKLPHEMSDIRNNLLMKVEIIIMIILSVCCFSCFLYCSIHVCVIPCLCICTSISWLSCFLFIFWRIKNRNSERYSTMEDEDDDEDVEVGDEIVLDDEFGVEMEEKGETGILEIGGEGNIQEKDIHMF